MADNVLITPGSGDTVAADDISSVKYQRVKLTLGADGVNDGDIAGNSGVVGATTQRVVHATDVATSMNIVGVNTTNTLGVYLSATAGTINVSNTTSGTVSISAKDGTFAVYFSPSMPSLNNVTGLDRVRNVVDGTLSTVTNVTTLGTATRVDRVMNVVDGTLTTVTGIDRVRNLVDGTISTVTNVTALNTVTRVDRVMNVVDGTISTVTFVPVVQRVQNVVDGTLSTVSRVSNVIDGTLTTVTTVGRVNHLIDGTVTVTGITSSIGVYFDRGNPSVTTIQGGAQAIAGSGVTGVTTQRVVHAVDVVQSMNIMAIGTTNTLGVYLSATAGTINVSNVNSGTIAMSAKDGTFAVYFSPSTPAVNLAAIGTTNTLGVYLSATAGTINVSNLTSGTVAISAKDGTFAVYFSPSRPVVLADNQHTSSIFTISGSTSGVSVSGVNLVAPSASYNFKVFAYSIQTTGAVSLNARFVNGSGASQTEFWRPLVTASGVTGGQGANLAVAPPGFIFATGTNTSLNILLDTATLTHYSVSYIKESA